MTEIEKAQANLTNVLAAGGDPAKVASAIDALIRAHLAAQPKYQGCPCAPGK